jgi:NADP-dependent 3-hydroxy acid dehydrogenase YdfG
MKLKPLLEQVVALMGALSGIGRESALRFASRGAKVVVSARNKDGLDSLVGEIQTRSGEATAVAADVTDYEAVKAVADRAAEAYGRLDTWLDTHPPIKRGALAGAALGTAALLKTRS